MAELELGLLKKKILFWIRKYSLNVDQILTSTNFEIKNGEVLGLKTFWDVVEKDKLVQRKFGKNYQISDSAFLPVNFETAMLIPNGAFRKFDLDMRWWDSRTFRFSKIPPNNKRDIVIRQSHSEVAKQKISESLKKTRQIESIVMKKIHTTSNYISKTWTYEKVKIVVPVWKEEFSKWLKKKDLFQQDKAIKIIYLIWLKTRNEEFFVSKKDFYNFGCYDIALLKEMFRMGWVFTNWEFSWGKETQNESRRWYLSDYFLKDVQEIEVLNKDLGSSEILHIVNASKFFKIDELAIPWIKQLPLEKSVILERKVLEINSGIIDYSHKWDSYGLRFHSSWTNLKKDIRKWIYYWPHKKEELIEIDASNSQFQILSLLIKDPLKWIPIISKEHHDNLENCIQSINDLSDILKNLNQIDKAQLEMFLQVSEEGKLYELMTEEFGLIKQKVFATLFSNERDSKKIRDLFISRGWNVLSKILVAFHQNQYSEFVSINSKKRKIWKSPLPMILQRIESTLWARGIAQNIKCPFILIHDSIIIKKCDYNKFLSSLSGEMEKYEIQKFHLKIKSGEIFEEFLFKIEK